MKAVKIHNPEIIKESIPRNNLSLWTVPIQRPGIDELAILLSDNLVESVDIPKTLVFVDSTIEANAITRWLRTKLPQHLRRYERDIIRANHGPIDQSTKDLTLQ